MHSLQACRGNARSVAADSLEPWLTGLGSVAARADAIVRRNLADAARGELKFPMLLD